MAPSRKRATIYDVAKEAGVSAMTVSRALRQGPKKAVSAETVIQINEIARKLDYHPNTGARALVLKKTFNIGVCINSPSFNYYERARHIVFRAMQTRLNAAGYHLGFYYFQAGGDSEFEVFLSNHRTVDAIVVFGGTLCEQEKDIIRSSGIRAISFLEPVAGLHSVLPGTQDAARQAADLIFERGFREATLLDMRKKGQKSRATLSETTGEAFLSRAKDLGLRITTMDEHWDTAYDAYYAFREGKLAPDLIPRLLASGEAGRCVFVPQDQYPLRIMQELGKFGLRAGKDISLVGLGNIEAVGWGPWKKPRLTTFDPQREKIGHLLADLAMGNDPAGVHKVPCILVERSSLGWGPARADQAPSASKRLKDLTKLASP